MHPEQILWLVEFDDGGGKEKFDLKAQCSNHLKLLRMQCAALPIKIAVFAFFPLLTKIKSQLHNK